MPPLHKPKPTSVRSVFRMLVWMAVTLWCIVPFIWIGGMFATTWLDSSAKPVAKKQKQEKKPPEVIIEMPKRPFDEDPKERVRLMAEKTPEIQQPVSPIYTMLSSSLMAMAFAYAIWCAAGVMCGVGMERMLAAFLD